MCFAGAAPFICVSVERDEVKVLTFSSVLFLALNLSSIFAVADGDSPPECKSDSDCILVSSPGCEGEFNKTAIPKKKPSELKYLNCKSTRFRHSDFDPGVSFKAQCANEHCSVKMTLKCKSTSDCSTLDCSNLNSPIKSNHKPECVDRKCQCMCRGCE